jgi:hypothetical protein
MLISVVVQLMWIFLVPQLNSIHVTENYHFLNAHNYRPYTFPLIVTFHLVHTVTAILQCHPSVNVTSFHNL